GVGPPPVGHAGDDVLAPPGGRGLGHLASGAGARALGHQAVHAVERTGRGDVALLRHRAGARDRDGPLLLQESRSENEPAGWGCGAGAGVVGEDGGYNRVVSGLPIKPRASSTLPKMPHNSTPRTLPSF